MSAHGPHFEVQVGGDAEPVAGVGTAGGLAHPADALTAAYRSAKGTGFNPVEVRIESAEWLTAARPAMFDHDVATVVRVLLIFDALHHHAIEHAKNGVVRHPYRFAAFIVTAGGTVGEHYGGALAGGGHGHRGDVHAAMKSLPAVAGPTGFAVIGVGSGARKKFLGRVAQRVVRRGPGDDHIFIAWQGDKRLIACRHRGSLPTAMSEEQSRSLDELREELRQLRARVAELEGRLDKLAAPQVPPVIAPPSAGAVGAVPVASEPVVPPPVAPPVIAPPPVSVPPVVSRSESSSGSPPPVSPVASGSGAGAPRESWEVRLGSVWLPRVGMLVLLTGIVFLVTWSYQFLGKAGKLALGYLVAVGLAAGGGCLRQRLPAFSMVLVAGAFALAYYMTYALHFVPALRVVESTAVALALLMTLVVVFVVWADRVGSATLSVLALFFGYYTSLVSGVGTFTLTANAVLAVAALVLAARHQWVPLSFGALIATYLAYVWWVGQPGWEQLWEQELAVEQFRVRAAFLGLYWLIFTLTGLMGNRSAAAGSDRPAAPDTAQLVGWLTLNNALLLLLFAGLMRRTFPGMGWAFYFPFAGALSMTAAVAARRFPAPARVGESLLWQALAVGTLGLVSYFRPDQLPAVLAVESALVLGWARFSGSHALRWLALAIYAGAVLALWREWPDRDSALLASAGMVAVMGWVNAILARRHPRASEGFDAMAGFFALAATACGWATTADWVAVGRGPWVAVWGALLVGVLGWLAKTREILVAAHLPLVGGWIASLAAVRGTDEQWDLAPTVALIAAIWGFGLVNWARHRSVESEPDAPARRALLPYALMAVVSMGVAVLDHAPTRWRWALWGMEALLLVGAGVRCRERLLVWLAFVPAVWGTLDYARWAVFIAEPPGRAAGWWNLAVGTVGLLVAERWLAWRGGFLWTTPRAPSVPCAWLVALATVTTVLGFRALMVSAWLTIGWALLGFALLLLGLALRHAAHRWAGLTTLALAVGRAVMYDLARLDTLYRVVTYLALGAMLLVLGWLYARWRERR